MLKRIISLLLALTMLAGYMPPMHVFAEEMVNAEYDATEETVAETEPFVEFTEVIAETVAETTQPETVPEETAAPTEETAAPTEETVAPTEEPEEILQVEEFVYTSEADYTSEELYEAYAASLFFGNSFSFFGTAAGEMLTGDEKTLYDALVPFIKQVACGQRESASISIGQALTGYPVDVEATFTGSGFTGTQLGRVIDALMADLPFEFYWYEKTSGCSASRISTGSSLLQIILSFSVADNYNTGDPFTADIAKTGAAAQSVARAKDIVNTYASKSDYEKLVGYKEEICDLVDYNWNAAWDNVFSTDIDPWQLIYVFDGNPETRVVCEGYSKAFQYLCDLTDFKGDVTCYAITGLMDGGGHMWNIVSIKDVNYFADVTNSDSDSIGYDGRLFLAGASGSVATGYTIGGIQYVYDEDTKVLWGAGEDSILNLSPVKYTPPTAEEEDEPVASGTCGENLTWELDEAGTLTISGTGDMENYRQDYKQTNPPWYDCREAITNVVIEDGVTGIGSYAFYDCTSLVNVAIGNGVTDIDWWAFSCCSSLTSITLPDGVTGIGGYAFSNCDSLTSITIPESVTNIEDCAFQSCSSLTDITIPEGITWLGKSLFSNCDSLTSITIPTSVEFICYSAFASCDRLTDIVIPTNTAIVENWAFAECTSLNEITFLGDAPEIGEEVFLEVTATAYYPVSNPTWTADVMQNYGGTITWIPYSDEHSHEFGEDGKCECGLTGGQCGTNLTWTLDDAGTLSISGTGAMDDYYAFNDPPVAPWDAYKEQIVSVVIGEGMTETGAYAFGQCFNLTSVTLPSSLLVLGQSTFWECDKLTEIALPSNLQRIEHEVFLHCGALTSIVIPASVTEIVDRAFGGNRNLTGIWVEAGNTAYCNDSNGVLFNKDMTKLVAAPASLRGAYVVPASVTAIGWGAFDGCYGLTSITLPSGLAEIGIQTFFNCSGLTTIEIPAGVNAIATGAFWGCSNLTSIEIPASVTSIEMYAFNGCSNLKDVYFGGTAEQWTVLGENTPDATYIHYNCIESAGHWIATTVEVTCTRNGYTYEICPCGYERNKVITDYAPGHKEVTNAAVAPTCTATGLTEGKRCAACNEVLVAQTVIDALGHTEVIDAAVAPTCTETGLTEGKHCSVCNEVLVAQEVVDALGHAEVIDEAVAATCTETGLTEGKHCSVCNEVLVAQEVVDAPGHKEVIDKGFAPDCTNSGLTEGSHCAVCGEICVVQEVVPALGHAYEVQNGEIVCAVCGETVTIHIHQDYVALDIYENPQVQLNVDVSPKTLEDDLQWRIEGAAGVLEPVQNGLVTALRAGTAYVVAELTVDGYTISSRCRVDVTENVQVKGVQLSTNKVTTELYKDEFATFEILLDLPQNHPFEGDDLMVTDDAAMAASGLENKSNLIKSVQFKNISDLFVLKLLDDRTVQIVPTPKAMKEGVKGTPSDTVVVTLRNGQTLETTEKLSLTVKKTLPKLKATIASFNSFYEGQSQKIVITGTDITGIRKNENVAQPIPNWLTLEDGCLKLNGNAPKASDKAYLLVDVDGWVDPVELTLTVKHAKKVPGIKLAATTVTVADRNASTEVELKLLCASKNDVLKDLNITGITAPKGYTVENFNAEDGTFTLKKEGGFTSGKITLTVSYGSETKALTLNVKTQAVKLKLAASKVSLNKELPDQAVVEVICATENYNFDLKDAVLTYDDKMLDIETTGNALIIRLKAAAVEGKTYPVSVSAYQNAPAVKLSVAALKKGSVVKSTIKATGTLDVIREDTAITVKPTYTNYMNVDVDTDAVLKIYSSKDNYKTAIAEVKAENGIFTIDSSFIGNHTLKYKAQLETKIGTETIKSTQISLSVKMGAAKLTAVSSGTTLFAKDRNDRAQVWFESTDASLNDVKTIEIKDAKYKDAFEIIDYRDGSFAICFKDGKIHESIAKQLEKKSSISITLNLNVFIEGNETVDPAISKTAKANATQKVKLTIVK